MAFAGFPAEAFAFYEGLEADNSKTYWTAHKDVYDTCVRAPMAELAGELAALVRAEPKLFRPHRDVRFAKDKSPYKTHQGAFFEVMAGVGYYVHVDAEGLFTAAGFYSHSREQTTRYRAAVDADDTGAALEKIVRTLARHGLTIGGDRVRTRPRGCPPDHPRLELMRHRSLTAARHHPAGPELEGRASFDLVRTDWRRLRPLVDWVETNVGPFEAE
ncbi:DUF2461 domain-containing protein [Phytohabitans kaempferiae]|uniref:DUF2461 domain-containing protein n=1 Tax=Phytohabitans kaempferiae TaxID=1620943 RepID=A0ABV6MGM2_9ACTN